MEMYGMEDGDSVKSPTGQQVSFKHGRLFCYMDKGDSLP